MFKSPKEARRAQAYLDPLNGDLGVEGEYGCWFNWRGAQRLEIGVNAGSSQTEVHLFVQREICRRFDVRRIGYDSVGWYKDSEFAGRAGVDYPGYTSWVAWAKDYKPEKSHEYRMGQKYLSEAHLQMVLSLLRGVETFVTDQFSQLDKETRP